MKQEEFVEKTLAFFGAIGVVAKKSSFYLEVNFDADGSPSNVYSSDTDTVFRLSVRPEEWSVFVNKPGKQSCIRVDASEALVQGQDAFKLVKRVGPITDVAKLFHAVEKDLGVKFPRIAFVRTNIAGAKKAVEKWVMTL